MPYFNVEMNKKIKKTYTGTNDRLEREESNY